MEFWKGQALGNDYIVVDRTGEGPPEVEVIRAICDRHRGVGSDGLLVADLDADPVGLRIFNPDGTEAEKSGNGLRIFGTWLHALGVAGSEEPFHVALPGEVIEMRVVSRTPGGRLILEVEIGRASFRAGDVPFAPAPEDEEVRDWPLDVEGRTVHVNPVSLGNPHCVVFVDELETDDFRRRAPVIQAHRAFTEGVNLQFARVAEPGVLEAFIWERGAGETLASGSSASAVVAAARHTGRVSGDRFEVRMPGGSVQVEVGDDWRLRLTGEAGGVCRGEMVEGWR
jgi:diaminopimelate epimerase